MAAERYQSVAVEAASFTEVWWLLSHPFPKAGEKIDLKKLTEQVGKETVVR